MNLQVSDILTVNEVAELLYTGRNTVYQLLASKELIGFRVGHRWRIPRENLEAYIQSKCSK